MPTPSKLEVARDNLVTQLDDLLQHLSTARRIEVEAATVDEISRHYRQLAIACLLLEADTDSFFKYAAASGLAYASMLERVKWDSLVDLQYLCASRALPFFDSIVAADFTTAEKIALNSRADWASADEEEVDFLRMRFLMELFRQDGRDISATAGLQDRLVSLVDPAEEPRVGVCLALRQRNPEAFEQGMVDLTEKLAREWTEERQNPNQDPEQILTEGHVSLEGVALVRLAQRVGIAKRDEYLLVPSLALADPPERAYSTDLWRKGA